MGNVLKPLGPLKNEVAHTFRLPGEVMDRLRKAAKESNRKLNQALIDLLVYALDANDAEGAKRGGR